MPRLLLFCLLLGLSLGPSGAVLAQPTGFVLRDRVLDADTRQPTPNAQVGVGDNRVGTSTNDDGRATNASTRLNWSAGPFVPLRFDFVHTRAEFIQPRRFPNYTYRVTDLTSFNGESVYVMPSRRAPAAVGRTTRASSTSGSIRMRFWEPMSAGSMAAGPTWWPTTTARP